MPSGGVEKFALLTCVLLERPTGWPPTQQSVFAPSSGSVLISSFPRP
jgi:hypothetical protein